MSASPVIDPVPSVRRPDIIDHLKNSERLMTARELASILAISPKTTVSDLPGPEQAKAFPVPANDGRGLDDKDAGLPIVPDGAQPGPQQAIRRGQFGSLDGALENAELMAESEDLKLQRRPAPEGIENGGQESRQ